MKIIKLFTFIALPFFGLSCSTQKISVTKEIPSALKDSATIFVDLNGTFEKNPELPDGFINKIWTDNDKSKKAVKEEVQNYIMF